MFSMIAAMLGYSTFSCYILLKMSLKYIVYVFMTYLIDFLPILHVTLAVSLSLQITACGAVGALF